MLNPNEKIDSWWIVVRTNENREFRLQDLLNGTLSDVTCERIDDGIEEELPVTWKE